MRANDRDRAMVLATEITAQAEGALAGLNRKMAKWPPEFRKIMWDAVAQVAAVYAEAAATEFDRVLAREHAAALNAGKQTG